MFRQIALVLILAVGAASAAEPPRIADFAHHPDFQSVELSPNGELLATTRVVKGRKILQILRVKDRQPIGAFQLAGDRNVEDVYWPNDDYVLFGASVPVGSLGHVTATGELMMVKIDGTRPVTLVKQDTSNLMNLSFNTRHWEIVDTMRDDPDSILISIFDDNDNWELANLYRLNVSTGLRNKVLQSRLPRGDFFSDPASVVRVQNGVASGESILLARKSTSDSWQEVARGRVAQGRARFAGFAADPGQIYVFDSTPGNADALYLQDIATKARSVVVPNEAYEFSNVLRGRDYKTTIGVQWSGARLEWRFFDDKHPDAVLFQSLRKALGDVDLEFTSFSDDGKMAVVKVTSDRAAPSFLVVDLAKPGLVARLPSKPWLDPSQMSPMQPVRYKARDGQEIQGYLTLPQSRPKGPAPMVVLPHGGPAGRDHWGFDEDVQLLASRGYAVLQMNFRGSTGYGGDFRKAGHGQWGKLMQNDVIDATRWAIQQGHADADRICIYGMSYGAYVAVEAVAAEPELYRCAVGYAGLYDLKLARDDSADHRSRAYWKEHMGGDVKDLDDHSPALHAERIKVPVFLVHGESDRTCPIEQFHKMKSALRAKGKAFEELVKPDEGHTFYEEANVEEFYTRLLAFLDQHTAPRAKQ